MTVYIEYVFMDNFAINLLILYITLAACRKKISVARLILSACIGSFFSVLYPFIGSYNYAVKTLLGLAMVLIAASYKNIKDLVRALIIFYLISFSLAGAVIMLSSYNVVHLTDFNGKYQLFPFCVTVSAFIMLFVGKYIIKDIYRKKIQESSIYSGVVKTEKGVVDINAFYDSGNRLYDPESRQPMVIISENLYEKLGEKSGEEVIVKTVGGIRTLKTVSIDFGIYFPGQGNKMYRVKAGVSESLNGDYDLILHTEMTGE